MFLSWESLKKPKVYQTRSNNTPSHPTLRLKLLHLLIDSSSEVPVVGVSPSRLTAVIASDVTMRCDIQGSYTRVEWSRADGRDIPDRALTLPDYSLRVSLGFHKDSC